MREGVHTKYAKPEQRAPRRRSHGEEIKGEEKKESHTEAQRHGEL